MDCNKELFLSEIVAFRIYKTSECSIPIPFNVPRISALSLSALSLPTPAIEVSTSGTAIQTDTAPSLTVSQERTAAGMIYTHALDATVTSGIDQLQQAVDALSTADFIMIATNAEGEQTLHYSCPGTSVLNLTVNNTDGSETATLKVTLKSLSSRIKL